MAAGRNVTAGFVIAAILAMAATCTGGQGADSGRGWGGPGYPAGPVRLIGDGSTAYTGRQPRQPRAERLKPGDTPPQFVVFSWDGAGEDGQRLFSHFRAVGRAYGASMTYFLSGVYLLPAEKRALYAPPRHQRGASEIGFNDIDGIRNTLEQLRGAWLEGSEVGTHFNGHFCGPDGGVGTWTTEEWISETRQARYFVQHWKTTTGLADEPPLPFDYARELVGGRAPCLEGQRNLLLAAKAMGFRYDASSSGGLQVWPDKTDGIWNFPLQQVPMPGHSYETLSMDYNFLANQSGTTRGDPARHAAWGEQMRRGLLAAFYRAYQGNRAPLFVGNHFESWNGGTYMRAVEDTIKTVCPMPDVRCVSFKQLADWLDAQEPAVLARLRALGVGRAPEGGWPGYLAAGPPSVRRAA
ncbi:hypothetical protein RKE29_00550 [Streptomyces sp. B1866]|uniref:hypothetical protein n=1 Tax=Streptomyces sp. B1866 TaxID=3075431 RepID=UPI00288D12B8|nr:hypothetical protein [Streptomyces sp. B1866]MDT3395158.1 hypothetical protein [Streptomyces sp. B1866]